MLTQRKEQEAEIMELRSKMAADLPMVSVTRVEGRRTIMDALDELTRGDAHHHARGFGRAQVVGGHNGDGSRPNPSDGVQRKIKDTLDGDTEEVKLTGEKKSTA